jgi:DNA-binding NarL/FixJ family response regulator
MQRQRITAERCSRSRQLKLDLLKMEIDLTRIVADCANWRGRNDELRESCRKTAARSYQRICGMLNTPGLHGLDADLAPKLAQLQAALAEPGSAGDLSTRPAHRGGARREANDAHYGDAQCESGPLTKRETDVLRCIVEGESTKQLAHTLGITFKTACCHRQRVMDKLGIHDTATLVRYAIRAGVAQP